MTTIVIKPKTKEEQKFLTSLLKRMNVEAHILEEHTPNSETQTAIEDVENRRGTKTKDTQDLFNKLNI